MGAEKKPTQLPQGFRWYFWDYDFDRLTWEDSRQTIMLRLLQAGGLDAVVWLRAHVADEEIRDFLVRRQGRGLEPRRLRFWGLILDIPRTAVDRWVAVARQNPWYKRTPA